MATPTRPPTEDGFADTSRTIEEMGRDAIGRTDAQVIGTSSSELVKMTGSPPTGKSRRCGQPT